MNFGRSKYKPSFPPKFVYKYAKPHVHSLTSVSSLQPAQCRAAARGVGPSERQETAAEAAKEAGASAEHLADVSQAAAAEANDLKIPKAARQAAGVASKHATGEGKMSREKAVGSLVGIQLFHDVS